SASRGAALRVEGAGLLAVRGDTAVVISGVKGAPELAVARGEIYVDLPKGTIHTFVVRTPTGSVHVTGTAFEVKAGAKATTVTVTRGSVKLVGAGGVTAVGAGEAATLTAVGAPTSGLLREPTDLNWVRELAPEHAIAVDLSP